MTVEVHETGHALGQQAVSGSVIVALLDLVLARTGEAGVAQALALAGERRPFAALGDAERWSPLDEAVSLLNAAALVTRDGAVGLHVGEALLSGTDARGLGARWRALGSAEAVLRHVEAVVDQYERTSVATVVELASDHALIRIAPLHDDGRHAHLCELTRGLLTGVPALFAGPPALVTETECSARGGRSCVYAVSWEVDGEDGTDDLDDGGADLDDGGADLDDSTGTGTSDSDSDSDPAPRSGPANPDLAPSDPGVAPRPRLLQYRPPEYLGAPDPAGVPAPGGGGDREQLQDELDRMEVLMEGALATALELLEDDADSLLSAIASRADAVVSGHRYLLMVRIDPGAPVKLHFRGMAAEQAQALAAQLWDGGRGQPMASPLVVDITSAHRHYGRLVELPPADTDHPPYEIRVLTRFAEYAATALDVHRALADSKRSDATARALLSFSEALSRVTELADLVQLMADTVPVVTDCDRSTVYLWERERGRLVTSAWTSGTEPPEPVGPVEPVGQAQPAGRGEVDDHKGLLLPSDVPLVRRMIAERQVIVLERSMADPFLAALLDRTDIAASLVAPLFAGSEFLGVVAADYRGNTPVDSIHQADLHERLTGLADQAATALQNHTLLERVSHMAWHDALTGLPNRRLFEDRVEQELVRSRRVGEPVCMFFVDIDHFKAVNDTYGHAAGDDLIRQVGQRLSDTVRSQDTVARVGGDEFAVLLPGMSDQAAIDQLAQRTLEAISAPFAVGDGVVTTSVSVGIAMAPGHGDSYDELLSRADEAMYRAKGQGRNAFQMSSGLVAGSANGSRPVDEVALAADLAGALQRRELFVVYQPYIDLRSSEVVGVEALVRWDHPTLGVLEPSMFLALAEQSDLIVAIDRWVLEEACRQLRTWLDLGLEPLRLSVNLASQDLGDPGLFGHVERTLDEHAIEPSLLELEISGRVVLETSGIATENIERLRRLRVRFTIDDFGTDNSSLNRIGSFPVSTLKIDHSFVQVLGPEGDNNALVAAIISMADRLGLDCVAAGVETAAQSRVLLQRGCTTAQGFYFSPPLAAGDIQAMMAAVAGEQRTAPVPEADGATGRRFGRLRRADQS